MKFDQKAHDDIKDRLPQLMADGRAAHKQAIADGKREVAKEAKRKAKEAAKPAAKTVQA